VITKVRNIRSEVNVPQSSKVKLHLGINDETAKKIILDNADNIKRLARVEEISITETLPTIDASARGIVSGIDLLVPLEGLIDFAKERERISREIAKRENEAGGLATRLGNPSFVERASAEVVQQARERHTELSTEIDKLRESLNALGN
jgi:valyl-tRNA synthetase